MAAPRIGRFTSEIYRAPRITEGRRSSIKVCHVAMADLWAGAEAQLAVLLPSLARVPDLEVSAILFNEGRLAHELRRAGIPTHVIPEAGRGPLSIVNGLRDSFRRHQIDVLHTHKYKDNILGALASLRQHIPYHVRTIHGSPEPFVGRHAMKMHVYEMLDGAINRWVVDRILAVSFALRDSLVPRFGTHRVTCVHNAIDVTKIRVTRKPMNLRAEIGLNEHDFVIGTMGRLAPVKGLELFLGAARIIKNHGHGVKFVVAGDGPSNATLQALTHEYRLDDDVLFLGHRSDSHDVLGIMDLFVLPSLSEGIPLVLLEALALERPVVATAVGGIPEVVDHGISGLLVPAGREDDLARGCLALMNDRVLARRLGAAGRERIQEAFSADTMAENVANVYRMLVGTGQRR